MVPSPLELKVLDAQGEPIRESQIIDLRARDDVGRFNRNIVKTVDPASLGLDVNRAIYC